MSILKTLGLILVFAIAVVLVLAAFKPETFRVQRSIRIQAPPEKVFVLIDDFHRWGLWSPYEALDPAMKRVFSGALHGRGAVYSWSGNGKAGEGRMEIVESLPPRKIVIRLDFVRPIANRSTAEFTLEPAGDATEVSWTMYGPSSYPARVAGVFIDVDALIGKDFERGLAALKAAAER